MWFIGVVVDQETSAPPPKKKSWIRPWSYETIGTKNATSYWELYSVVEQTFSGRFMKPPGIEKV